MRARLRCALVALVLAAGCRDEQAGPRPRPPPLPPPASGAPPAPSRASAPEASQAASSAPADLTFRSGATWAGGAVVYLGSRVTPPRAKAGERVTVASYFQLTQAPPQGYQFFMHVVDPASGQMLMNADHELQAGPLEQWPVGKVVEDSVVLPVPSVPGGQARVLLGFWQGDQRLHVDDARTHDGTERVIGPPIEVEVAQLPEYHVRKVSKPPVIDGDLSDAVWSQATAVELGSSMDGRPTVVKTRARLLYDDAHLYVAFDCEDPDVWGNLLKRDDPIYTEEAVEVFLDANADGRTYNELEVSPNNTVFDAYFPARRQGMDLSFDAQMKTAVKVRGTLNDPSDRDEGWTVEMQIPFKPLAEVPHLPPKKGDRWKFNLYRLEHLQRRQVEGQSFSPLFMGDFHNLPRFGWLVFE